MILRQRAHLHQISAEIRIGHRNIGDHTLGLTDIPPKEMGEGMEPAKGMESTSGIIGIKAEKI